MSEEKFNILLSDGLVHKIRQEQIIQSDPGLMLRVSIHGGGCAGFQYAFEYTNALETGDVTFEKDGARVVVDEVSLPYLDGATIDFSDELIGAAFSVHNPNAQSSCGCGTSFSV